MERPVPFLFLLTIGVSVEIVRSLNFSLCLNRICFFDYVINHYSFSFKLTWETTRNLNLKTRVDCFTSGITRAETVDELLPSRD